VFRVVRLGLAVITDLILTRAVSATAELLVKII